MGWFLLLLAGCVEVAATVGLGYSKGFTRLVPSVLTLCCFTASFALLTLSLKSLPLGTAYAVWTGMGTVGTAILGMMLFHEPATVARIACISLIVGGVIGLKLVTQQH